MTELWQQLLLVAVCALIAGGLAYWLATNRAARDVAGRVLNAALVTAGEYVRTHPLTPEAQAALVAFVYQRLPADVQRRVPYALVADALTQLLQLLDVERRSDPAAEPDARELAAGDDRALGEGHPLAGYYVLSGQTPIEMLSGGTILIPWSSRAIWLDWQEARATIRPVKLPRGWAWTYAGKTPGPVAARLESETADGS